MAEKQISGYDVKRGDKFHYGGNTYEAAADARGESNAYISVVDSRSPGGASDIIVRHGNTVTLLEATS
jgi:hypothetical protein